MPSHMIPPRRMVEKNAGVDAKRWHPDVNPREAQQPADPAAVNS